MSASMNHAPNPPVKSADPTDSAEPTATSGTMSKKSKKPWRTLAADLLLLGTASSLMVYGAPAHASARTNGATANSHSIAEASAHGNAGATANTHSSTGAVTHAGTLTLSREGNQEGNQEGTLVSATLLQRVPAKSVRTELAKARLAPGAPALGGGEARYGVDAYRVMYRTEDANGRPVVASGLVAFPSAAAGPGKSGGHEKADQPDGLASLPVVSYDHGTTATSADTPSSFGLGPDHAVEGRWSAELFASAGFAVTEPDYVGMGTGTGPIEYLVAKSEVSASADLITAARTLAKEHSFALQHKVFVTGFSQGGQAAMALGRDLQRTGGLRALAPVSGPYELLTAELPGLFNGQLSPAMEPYYVGYVLTTWNRLYHLYQNPAQAFRAPYASEMASLFSGRQQDATVVAKLPSKLDKLLTPAFYARIEHPAGAMRRAFEVNATCSGWRPDVPVKLFAASGDTTVTQVNAEQCAKAIKAPVVQLGDVSHDVSDFVALPRILRWFQRLS